MPKPPAPPKPKFTWRQVVRWSMWVVIFGALAWSAKTVNAFLVHDPRFDLEPTLEIHGAVYANRARIRNVFAQDFGASIFQVPLAERRRRLLAVDWVNSASISRVWPSHMIVNITERNPVAFAKLPIGGSVRYRFALIDRDGVLLSIPPHVRFRLPVLSGVNEQQTEGDRSVRVHAMQHLLDDLGPQAKDISEVNAANTQDMRVIIEIDGHAVELWVGDQRYRSRYQHFLSAWDEIRKHSERATVFDLRMDDRILAK
jgi:cell division protein FtsQ